MEVVEIQPTTIEPNNTKIVMLVSQIKQTFRFEKCVLPSAFLCSVNLSSNAKEQ